MIFAVAVIVAACGGSSTGRGSNAAVTQTSDSTAEVGQGAGSGTECHDETPIGSTIPRRVCRSQDQKERERRGAEDWARPSGGKPTSVK
jgi:hypothetical protein